MSQVVKFDEKMQKGLLKYLSDDKQIELAIDSEDYNDQEAIMQVVLGALEYFGITCGEIKSEEEPVTLSLPGYMDMTVSYREGSGDGNWGIGITAGEEIKKRIKDDAMLEDLSDTEE